jgi:hypothetical protein
MVVHEVEVVVNVEFGGFHLDTEMAIWLMEIKGWTVTEDPKESETTRYDLFGMGDCFWPTAKHTDKLGGHCDISFRMNRDLIECVKTLKNKRQGLSCYDRWMKTQDHKVLELGITTVQVHIEVEDVNDGKENIKCWTTEK